MAVNDGEIPVSDTAVLEQSMRETIALRDALQQAIGGAAAQVAEQIQRPVHPEVLAGLLLMEAAGVALRFAVASRRTSPYDIEEYFDELVRRARRGLRVQIAAALSHPVTPGKVSLS